LEKKGRGKRAGIDCDSKDAERYGRIPGEKKKESDWDGKGGEGRACVSTDCI